MGNKPDKRITIVQAIFYGIKQNSPITGEFLILALAAATTALQAKTADICGCIVFSVDAGTNVRLHAALGGFMGCQETLLMIHRRVTTDSQMLFNITIFFFYVFATNYTIHSSSLFGQSAELGLRISGGVLGV